MGNLTMTQYLTGIKSKVDAIATVGVNLDPEDIIYHTLNGLPPSYQIFKMTIQTNLQPFQLDDFYSPLCSEESNIVADTRRELQHTSPTSHPTTLYTNPSRGRGRSNFTRGCHSPANSNRPLTTPQRGPVITCQICNKPGHSAFKCWHRGNFSYQPPSQQLLTATYSPAPMDWLLDIGSTAHLTPHHQNLLTSQPYQGD